MSYPLGQTISPITTREAPRPLAAATPRIGFSSVALGAIALTVLLWASAFPAIRAGLAGYSPIHLALLRFLVGSIVFAAIALFRGSRFPQLSEWPRMLTAALIGITVYHFALNYGEMTVSSASASFIINLGPVFTALLALAFLGESVRPMAWMGMAVSVAGTALIAFGEGEGFSISTGALFVLAAAICQAIYFVMQKPFLKTFTPVEFTSVAVWCGTFMMLPFGRGLIAAVESAPLHATLAVIYMGIFPGALGYVTWAYAMKQAPASNVASFLYLVPPLAMVIAWVWLGEVPSAIAILGGTVALAGVMLVNPPRRKSSSPAASAAAPLSRTVNAGPHPNLR